MEAVPGTGDIVSEPHWRMLLNDDLEIQAAGEHWRRIVTEMRERTTLAATNGQSIQRLIIAYILYDRSAREVLENGSVTKPKRGNPKAKSTNAGKVFVGGAGVTNADDGSGAGYALEPGEAISFAVTNCSAIYIIGTAGDVVYVSGN